MAFPERLRALRNQKNISQTELSYGINVTIKQIQRYEAGDSEPTLSKLVRITNYFKVSIDYLAGRTDNPEINK